MKFQIVAASCAVAAATSYTSFDDWSSFGESYALDGSSSGGLPPAWISGDQEAPACEKDMGSWVAAVFCPEQMERLSVDEFGETNDDAERETPSDLMPLDWNKPDDADGFLGKDEATYTPEYIMEKEDSDDLNTVTLTNNLAAQALSTSPETPKSSTHTGGIVAGVAAVGLITAFVTLRRRASNDSPGEFDYSTL